MEKLKEKEEKEIIAEYNNKDAIRPDGSFKKWNWGAFSFSFWWGIGNRVWLCFLMLIPFFHLIWMFIMAYNGNKWAYDKYLADGHKDIDNFNYAQKTWNSAGFWAFIVILAVAIFWIIFIMVIGIVGYNSGSFHSNGHYDY